MVVLHLITLSFWFFPVCLLAQDKKESGREAVRRQQSQEELKNLNQEIENLRNSIQRLESDRMTTVRTLEQYRLQRQVHLREIRKLTIEINKADQRINELEDQSAQLLQTIAKQQDDVGLVIRKLFITGKFSGLKALLSVKSAQDVGLAHSYLSFLAKRDFGILLSYRDNLENLRKIREELSNAKQNLLEMKNKEEGLYRDVKSAEREQEKILGQIREKRGVYNNALQEKLAAQQDLVNLIEQLGGSSSTIPTARFNELRGILPWPVTGPIITKFGKIRDAIYDVEIENDGIDIQAPIGTPVKAVSSGKVVFSDWRDAGGNMVVLDHGNGYYSLYTYLSRFDVKVNETVEAGQVIGAVGETGSLKGPVLHFEIRQIIKGQGQQALDPVKWLRKQL